MSSVDLVPVTNHGHQVPVIADTTARLYDDFLAGRTANTLAAYAKDFAAFALFMDATSPADALSRLIALSPGEGNGKLLSWRAAMQTAKLSHATINRRLSAVRSALRFTRTIGRTHWVPEVQGLKTQAFRDTRGPGIAGTRALLEQAATKAEPKRLRDTAIIRSDTRAPCLRDWLEPVLTLHVWKVPASQHQAGLGARFRSSRPVSAPGLLGCSAGPLTR